MKFDRILRRVDELEMVADQSREVLESNENELMVAKTSLEHHEEAQSIVQTIAQKIQQQVHEKISRIVSRCLSAVFENEPYEFAIRFDCKRGKTEARLMFLRDGMELDDPMYQIGGGVIDVAALALRLSCILLARPRRRRLLVLDEPLKNVRGKQNRKNVRALLEALADELDMQIILNVDTDSYPEFVLGTVIEME